MLPFVNLSGDSRHDFLVDSVTDQLTSELARVDDSFVVSRKAALGYRGDALEVTELGLELGVRFVIKGSLRAAGRGMRLNIQLIDAESAQPLWVERFDLALDAAFTMQHDAIARLIPPLHAHLLAASGQAPQPAPTVLPEQPRAGAPTGRGGNVVHPRGATQPSNVRVATAPRRPSLSPPCRLSRARAEPRPAPVVRVAPGPAAAPARTAPRAPFRIPFLVKLAVVAVAGVAAVAMLGAQRRSVVEIISWMLIAAGAVQLVATLARSRA